MSNTIDRRLLAELLISQFRQNFRQLIGITPEVIVNLEKYEIEEERKIAKSLQIELSDLEKIVNVYIPQSCNKYNTIRARTKKREMVNLRFIFTFMAYQIGYSNKEIAGYLGLDHSTIINQRHQFNNLIGKDDMLKSDYENIKNDINTRRDVIKLLSTVGKIQTDPKSTLHTILQEEQQKSGSSDRKQLIRGITFTDKYGLPDK